MTRLLTDRHLVSKIASSVFLLAFCGAIDAGTLTVYLSPPSAQSSTVAGVTNENFDQLSTGVRTTAYTSIAGIGTYTGSSSNPMAVLAPGVFGGGTDSTHSSATNYFAVGNATSSTTTFRPNSRPAA